MKGKLKYNMVALTMEREKLGTFEGKEIKYVQTVVDIGSAVTFCKEGDKVFLDTESIKKSDAARTLRVEDVDYLVLPEGFLLYVFE